MNSDNSKISDSHRLLLNTGDPKELKKSGKYVVLLNLSIYYKLKIIKTLLKYNEFI